MTTPGTPLHCFACEQFSAATTNELQCSRCGSEAVEIIESNAQPDDVYQEHARQPPVPEPPSYPAQVPGFQGMFQNILSSILPGVSVTSVNPPPQASQHPAEHQLNNPNPAEESHNHERGPAMQNVPQPIHDFFTHIFGAQPQTHPAAQASESNVNANDEPPQVRNQPHSQPVSRHFHTTHQGPGGSSVSFSFHSTTTTGPPVNHFVSHNLDTNGANNMHNPFVQHFPAGHPPTPMIFTIGPDGQPVVANQAGNAQHPFAAMPGLSQFIAQALGHVPGTQFGDYASGEAFDNIISELMNRNPQSNVRPATQTAISQMTRVKLAKNDSRLGEECSICQDDYALDDQLVELKCRHHYHEECLTSWLTTNGVCPICRAPVLEQPVVVEQDELD